MPDPAAPLLRERALAVLLRPVLGALLRRYLQRQGRPEHDDRVLVVGTNPIRVLVVGGGMVVGYGADGLAPSLARRLAQALAAETGRGAVVESRAQAAVRLERTIEFIGTVGAATFDVVVWSPTLVETFRGGSRRWRRELRTIVQHLRATGPARLQVLLMGVPEAQGDHVLQRSGRILVRSVNLRIGEVADGFDRVEFMPVPQKLIDRTDTPLFDADYQAEVVRALASAVAVRLGAPQPRS